MCMEYFNHNPEFIMIFLSVLTLNLPYLLRTAVQTVIMLVVDFISSPTFVFGGAYTSGYLTEICLTSLPAAVLTLWPTPDIWVWKRFPTLS